MMQKNGQSASTTARGTDVYRCSWPEDDQPNPADISYSFFHSLSPPSFVFTGLDGSTIVTSGFRRSISATTYL